MFKRGDSEYIADMLMACKRILEFTRGLTYDDFCKNNMVVDAVVRNIEILGEATKSVSEELKKKYPEVEWREIAKTRDKVIHFYFGVDVSIIWDIVTMDIPTLKDKLKKIQTSEGWKFELED